VGFLKGRNYLRGIGDALHFSKNSCQNDPTRPEAGKNPKTQQSIKTNCLPSRILWRHMKGTWEKYCEIRENMKG